MSVGAVLGALVGVGAMYVGARPFVFARRRHEAKLADDEFERRLLELRDAAAGDFAWRAAGHRDAADVSTLDLVRADDAALLANGFRRLGELVYSGRTRAVARVYVDAAGTTCAQLIALRARGIVTLTSFAAGGRVSTSRGPSPRLASPPGSHFAQYRIDLPIPQLVEAHDRAVRTYSITAAPIASLDQVVAAMMQRHDAARAWRETHPPDVLLEADLRSLLGPRYDQIGEHWLRRLRSGIPKATLRRTS